MEPPEWGDDSHLLFFYCTTLILHRQTTLQVKSHGKKDCLMNFIDLKDFLTNRMRMSHIYQPVMLMTLLKNGGVVSVESLAKDLFINHQTQIGYYQNLN